AGAVHGRLAERPAVPPAEGVVPRPLRLGPLRSVAAAAGVDDVRVDGADVLEVDLQLPPGGREIARQEDVGVSGQLVQQLLAFGRSEVDGDRTLPAAVVLEAVVAAARLE